MLRRVAAAMVLLVLCLPATAAGGDVKTGLWANSKAACKAAKQGDPEITTNVAAMASNEVSWEEAVCKFGALSSAGGKAVRPLACNGALDGQYAHCQQHGGGFQRRQHHARHI